MYNIYIVGAGGFGKEIYSQAQSDYAHNREWTIAGFLDGRSDILNSSKIDARVVGDPLTYQVLADEHFIMGLSSSDDKKKYAENILKQNGKFINLCTDVKIAPSSIIGSGNVFGLRAEISVDCEIGDFVSIQAYSLIGHDVKIKSYTHIGAQCFIGGGTEIGHGVTIHPHSTIAAGSKIGDNVTIAPGSVVFGKIPAGITVMGNPAKRFSFQ